MNEITITFNMCDYIEMLEDRKAFVEEKYGWKHIPDCLWEYFINDIETNGIQGNATPMYVVDNAIVNGDYGDFDEYKDKDETDEEFYDRMVDNCYYINLEERVYCQYL